MNDPHGSTAEQEQLPTEALDFVYCGRRTLSNGKMGFAVAPIRDGKLQRQMLFPFDRKAHRAVGGVYSGAEFNDSQALGLNGALKYVRRWTVQHDLVDWQARDDHAESEARTKKLEGDAKKVSEIERVLLPLRVQYESYRKRRDHAGMEALRSAMLNALMSAPRTGEV